MKKIKLLLLTMTLVLSGCMMQKSKKTAAEFDEYLKTLPSIIIENDSMDINYLYNHPENSGIEKTIMNLPDAYSFDEFIESNQEIDTILNELDEFDYKEMDESQKLTYDILYDYLERNKMPEEFYLLDSSFLGSYIGFQAQLPLLLSEFTIHDKTDLDSYFNILESCEEVFHSYYELEKKRNEAGVGLTKTILNKVIEQTYTFAQSDVSFLVDRMNEKIETADFLNEIDKNEAKAKNAELTFHNLRMAYQKLGDNLSTINNAREDLGLAHVKDGKKYYAYLIKTNNGIDESVEEIKNYLYVKSMKYLDEARNLLNEHPLLLTNNEISYGDFASAQENLDYLKTAITKYYPEIDHLNYTINFVPEAMQDNFSPAAYITSKIDKQIDENEVIFINGEYNSGLFTTLAHEGYPGHMYQNVFLHNLNLPEIRYLINYDGYSEGWATYVEWQSYKLSQKDQLPLQMMALNDKLVACYIAIADIGIHYEGWDFEQFYTFMSDTLGLTDRDIAFEQYLLNLETPANYLNYFLNGFYYEDLYKLAEKELKDKFDPVEFNRVLLTCGPSSYDILEKEVKKYLK